MLESNRRQYRYGGEPWGLWPEAERFIQRRIDDFFCDASQKMRDLREKIEKTTHTHFLQWVDYIAMNQGILSSTSALYNLGFQKEIVRSAENYLVFWHPETQLPRIMLNVREKNIENVEIGIKVDSVDDFRRLFVRRMFPKILDNVAGIEYDFALCEGNKSICVIARHGSRNFLCDLEEDDIDSIDYETACIYYRNRKRQWVDNFDGMYKTEKLVDELVTRMGCDVAADIVMRSEREYWQSRNSAAKHQYAIQNSLGLGWANSDHHTFRSSRDYFHILVKIFEKLGFHCRERFYAGAEAGWGAQVLENPVSGHVVFADVDLLPHEVDIDFAHEPLVPNKEQLGTIGLWCALHGESIGQAGMHHLEIQCDFDAMRMALEAAGIKVMKPFNDTSHLRQAFTEGEMWKVENKRIKYLSDNGLMSVTQAEKLSKYGAVGSHLELLERRGGFKGFSQAGVSTAIRATDPRNR